ncbi:MAG: saccharopine dehydrogenase NADP-binding domain-containing protein [Deltaproteobacteria bacterium]|nr:saccharopine dehydrogenase NADP-binding domain-containing protein [Deltaproteobacteria bacterium]
MAKVVVLGGCGAVGRHAVRTLAAHEAFDRVVVGDLDAAAAEKLAAESGAGVEAVRVDVGDETAVRAAIRGARVVLNCTGPFYRFGVPVLRAAIAERVDYVDVCDDVDATLAQLGLDGEARAAGVSALIGMGNSPGVTNLLAKFAAEQLLDEVDAVDIYHAHGGEPIEGAGVIAHRFHCMTMEIPMFLGGELRHVRFFEADGMALRTTVDLPRVGQAVPVYPYPHPEQITLPRHVKLRRVTNRGTVLPDEYYRLTTEMARLGLHSPEPLEVGGSRVVPHDFAVAWLQRERERILRETSFGSQRGCMKVVAAGTRHGKPRRYEFSMSSSDQALGEGTGIPAAMGAILMGQGRIERKGVFPPEAGVAPLDFLGLVQPILALAGRGKSFDGIAIDKIDENGTVERIAMAGLGG